MTLQESIKEYKSPGSKYNTVRYHGRKLFNLYNCCQICGYTNIIQVCHIKGIATFPLDTKVKEINDPTNIAILCPNHHGELDRGIITANDIPERVPALPYVVPERFELPSASM